jgi:glycosyltransferase involved in cell wall biosynthesis
MISCLHGLYDDRIYWKEALSLKRNGYEVTHVGVGEGDRDFISEEGIRLIQVSKKQYFRNPYLDKIFRLFLFKPAIYPKVFQIAADIKADVYHFHDLQINKIGRKLKNLSHRPRIIYDVHEPYPEAFRYAPASNPVVRLIHFLFSVYIRHWELRCAERYDIVLATEENVANKFKDQLGDENRVNIIYNYTNLSPESEDYSPDNKIYDAIYAGSIRSTRGIFQMIHAIKMAGDKGHLFKVLFIGPVFEKDLKKKIFRLLNKYMLQEQIVLMDPVPYEKISKFYEQSKTGLIIFSDNPVNRIILPIKLFEYMAFGLPVLSSDFGHMKKYTEMEKTGLTINPSSPKDICDKLITLLTNHDLYATCSSNGRSATNQKYKWELMEARLLEIYKGLLN